MTRLVQFANNAVSKLASGISSSATTLTVLPGEGAKFPALTGSKYFTATLVKVDGSTEIVKVTGRSTDTFTIVRTFEPVAGASTAYSFSAGDRVELRLTAGVIGGEIDRLDNGSIFETLNKSANYTVTEADVTTLIRVNSASGAIAITLPQISSLTDDFDVIVAKVSSDANSVTIQRSGTTDLINGATSTALLNQYQSAWIVADRSTNTWTVVSGGLNAVNTVVDSGTGDGVATTVTLSGDPISKNNVFFVVGGVYQQKSTYTLSGTTLTPGGVIPNGVKWEAVWSAPLTVGTPSDGTVTTVKLADNALAATTAGLAKMADGFLQATASGLAKMADLFVTTAKIADAAVTDVKLAAGAAVSNIGTGGITATQLSSNAVTTVKILDANVTPAKLSQKLTLAAAVASTSGSAIDFTGIPSWVKRITVMLSGVSTSGTSNIQLQLGAGSIEVSSYLSMAGLINTTQNTTRGATNTTGFIINATSTVATDIQNGNLVFISMGNNIWTCSGVFYNSTGPNISSVSGSKSLSGALDRVRITTVNGTDTFDAGSINILYEG